LKQSKKPAKSPRGLITVQALLRCRASPGHASNAPFEWT